VTINRLYTETMERLEGALAAVCADFRPSHYTRVLEGYMFLGNVAQVRHEERSVGASRRLSAVQLLLVRHHGCPCC